MLEQFISTINSNSQFHLRGQDQVIKVGGVFSSSQHKLRSVKLNFHDFPPISIFKGWDKIKISTKELCLLWKTEKQAKMTVNFLDMQVFMKSAISSKSAVSAKISLW